MALGDDASGRDVELEQHAERGRDRPPGRDDRVAARSDSSTATLQRRSKPGRRHPERLVHRPRVRADDVVEVLEVGVAQPLVGIGEQPELAAVEPGVEHDPFVGPRRGQGWARGADSGEVR